mmetsp:Transcript_8122/g.13454  ORF Transcript_8122/g.13454 Transcript_8122/m.13454 type:complete len:202 (-) Transcript_8122:187-792(-)
MYLQYIRAVLCCTVLHPPRSTSLHEDKGAREEHNVKNETDKDEADKELEGQHVSFSNGSSSPWTRMIKSFHHNGTISIVKGPPGTVRMSRIIPSPRIFRLRWGTRMPIQNPRISKRRHGQSINESDGTNGPYQLNQDIDLWQCRQHRPKGYTENEWIRDEQEHGPVGAHHPIQFGTRVSFGRLITRFLIFFHFFDPFVSLG